MNNDYEEVVSQRNQESELRAMREEEKVKIKQEKGQGGKTLGEDEDEEEDTSFDYPSPYSTPIKENPMMRGDKKQSGYYGEVFQMGSPKPTNDGDSTVLTKVKEDLEKMTVKELKAYIKNLADNKAIPAVYNRRDLINIATRLGYENETNTKTGSGLRRRRITGRGSPERTDSEGDSEVEDKEVLSGKKMFLNNHKFAINLEKLRRNILHVFYVSSRASIPSLKREHISSDTRDVLLDILGDKYSDKLFNKLQPDEQRLISTFVRIMKFPIDMKEFDESYEKNYQVLMGQVNSGQNNPKVKAELKLYILRGISENLIPKSQGQLMLYNLSL
jgi:hypothetical protein